MYNVICNDFNEKYYDQTRKAHRHATANTWPIKGIETEVWLIML